MQLRKIADLVSADETVFVSTNVGVAGADYPVLHDASLKNAYRLLLDFRKIIAILRRERPDYVLSTGAAPGLFFCLVAKVFGYRTIWVDSVANCTHLSLSGKIASRFCTLTLSQWPDLAIANKRVKYYGGLL